MSHFSTTLFVSVEINTLETGQMLLMASVYNGGLLSEDISVTYVVTVIYQIMDIFV